MAQTKGILERVSKLSEKGTTVKTEILAGLTTFVAMAYIIFVNPSILADAGIPKEAAIAATVWSAVIGSAAMGLWANFPVAVAPGMGLNASFAVPRLRRPRPALDRGPRCGVLLRHRVPAADGYARPPAAH